jgi:TonB family protein
MSKGVFTIRQSLIPLWPSSATFPHPVAIVTIRDLPHITFVMLELRQRPMASAAQVKSSDNRQLRRLLLALTLLLTALLAVIIRDRDFWFGNEEAAMDADTTSAPATTAPLTAQPAPATAVTAPASQTLPHQTPAVPATKKLAVVANAASSKTAQSQPQPESQPQSAAPAVVTNRTALAPLDVEVVAGDNHRVVRPGSNAVKVEVPKSGSSFGFSQPAFAAVTNAADRERVATGIETAPGSYEATYPLLSQHMNVQGSVVLQALIGADGVIENLHVLSGPAILSSAAQQAVREWHFKPYMLNGQPVETKARITVNFTIKVADNSANIS